MNLDNLDIRKERKLYIGKVSVKVLGVNPTREEIAKLTGADIERINEPDYNGKIVVYVGTKDGNVLARGTFWPKNKECNPAKTGSIKYINSYCQTAYIQNIDNADEQDWYSRNGARKCREGEEELYAFFTNWLNIDTDAGRFLDEVPFEELCKGNVDVFHKVMEKYPDNELVVKLGVVKGKYQEFFTREFGRTLAKKIEGYGWKAETGDNFTEYTGANAPDALESGEDLKLPF